MRTIYITITLILLFISTAVFATGPSYVRSWIRPISVNQKGDILCRTRYEDNPMGGHWYTSSEYGLCIITDGKIIEYLTKRLDNGMIGDSDIPTKEILSEEEYMHMQKHWDWVYNIGLDFTKLSGQQKLICDKYNFNENNAEEYKVDERMTITALNKKTGIDISSKEQHALKGATSQNMGVNKSEIHLLYRFEKVLIFNNFNADYPEKDIGYSFNYVNPSEGTFEYFDITSIFFLK